MRKLALAAGLAAALVASDARAWDIDCDDKLCAAVEDYRFADGSAAALLIAIQHDGQPLLALQLSRWRLPPGEARTILLTVDGQRLAGTHGVTTERGLLIPVGPADLDQLATGRALAITTPSTAAVLPLTGSRRALQLLRAAAAARRQIDPWAVEGTPPKPNGPEA